MFLTPAIFLLFGLASPPSPQPATLIDTFNNAAHLCEFHRIHAIKLTHAIRIVKQKNTAGFSADPAKLTALAQRYAQRVSHLAAGGAKMVVLPEGLFPVTPDDWRDVFQIMRDVARTTHVTLIVGVNRVGRLRRNVAVVINPDGAVVTEYKKRHLVPGESSSSSIAGALLVQDIPLGPGHTLYSRFGDWFPLSCFLAVIALLSVSFYRWRLAPEKSQQTRLLTPLGKVFIGAPRE